MRTLIVIAALLLAAISVAAENGPACAASINGLPLKNVFIEGSQTSAVIWAYKHLSEATCLTPVTDVNKANAILVLVPISSGAAEPTDYVTVNCISGKDSTTCTDSNGYELSTVCSASSCSSYYGPSAYSAVSGAFNAWLSSRWYETNARLYTINHKILWKSENTKGDWLGAQWPDLLRIGTNSPQCKCGSWQRSKYKNYRHWASTRCGVTFSEPISIDVAVKPPSKADIRRSENEEMIKNAQEAAKQKAAQP